MAPPFEPEPAAMQLAELAHDTASRSAPLNDARVVQFAPPSDVARTSWEATAVQDDVLMQSTDRRVAGLVGVPWSCQVDPPSVVVTTWEPTAVHVVVFAHEMPLIDTPAGAAWGFHVVPPLVVRRMAAPGPPEEMPTAVQFSLSAHEIPVKLATTAGKA
jgi:hypothetical protein